MCILCPGFRHLCAGKVESGVKLVGLHVAIHTVEPKPFLPISLFHSVHDGSCSASGTGAVL